MVTVLNQLKICVKNGSTFSLHNFNKGTSGSNWIARSGNLDGNAPLYSKNLHFARTAVRHDNLYGTGVTSGIYRVLKDDETETLAESWSITLAGEGLRTVRTKRLKHCRNMAAYSFYQSATGLESGPVQTVIEGTTKGVHT